MLNDAQLQAALNIALVALDHDLAFFSIDDTTTLQRERVSSTLQDIRLLLLDVPQPAPARGSSEQETTP